MKGSQLEKVSPIFKATLRKHYGGRKRLVVNRSLMATRSAHIQCIKIRIKKCGIIYLPQILQSSTFSHSFETSWKEVSYEL